MKATRLLRELFRVLWIEVARLAKLYIYKIGGVIDVDGLTAVQGDVRASKTFIGQGSEEKKSGTIVERGSPNLTMPINGTVTLPEGYYTGGKITQSIPTLGEQKVTPGKNAVTVNTSGKYMTGNVIVAPIKGLTPSVIKKGEYVGNVGPGTYEGYINEDPYTPYYYGTFGPGYTMSGIKFNASYEKGEITLNKDNIELDNAISSSRGVTSAIVFNKQINLSNVSKLTITARLYKGGSRAPVLRATLAQNLTDALRTGLGTSWEYRKELGEIYVNKTWNSSSGDDMQGDFTLDLSGYSQTAYLYISNEIDYVELDINAVRFT